MPELLDLAQLAVAAAMKAGAHWADAYCGKVRHAEVGMDNSSIIDCHIIRDYGLGVRAFFKGGMGSATVQSLDPEAVRQCGEEAARMAKVAHPDPDFVALPDPTPVVPVPGLFDDAVAGLPAEVVVSWCREAIEEAQTVCPEGRVSGGAGFSVGESALASSTGIALSRPGTSIDMSVATTIQRGEDVGFYFEDDFARRLEDFVPQGLGAKATEQALRYLGAQTIPTGRFDLVVGPLESYGFLAAIIGAASAENVQRQRSYLCDRAGEPIGPACLTILERPLHPAGISSAPYDGEGVARTDQTLIDGGVLTDYLHNSYTANKAGVPNNAHGVRGGYGGGVGIGPSNLQITPGDRTEAEFIAGIKDGLYIAMAGLNPDGASGDVSATVDFGFRIINGEIAYPVKQAMIGSDVFTMLSSLVGVSRDYREEPGLIAPSLCFHNIQVAGAQ